MPATEYAIWGIPQGETEERLLVAMPNGEPITSRADADRYVVRCRALGASSIRIQTITGALPDFSDRRNVNV